MANINTLSKEDLKIVDVPLWEIEEFLDPLGFHMRAKYLYTIRDKDGKEFRYVPWHPQKIVDRIIRQEHERSLEVLGRVQVLIQYLKSRQEGLSTDTTLRIIDKMIFRESFYAQVLAHDEEGTGLLYSQYERAFNDLPHFIRVVDDKGRPVSDGGAPWMIPIKPAGGPTKKGITFKSLTHSRLLVQTAGKGDNAGKAGSLNGVHYSENANYREHDKVISSTNQQLGGQDIFGVKESTANGTTGIGEGFYKDWTAEEKAWMRFQAGESETFEGWRPVFLPWYWMPSYRKPLYNGKKVSLDGIEWESEKEKQEYLEWEEQVEQEIIPRDPEIDHESYDVRESTNFYRDVIKTKCQRKLSDARRYYPTTPQEAFVTSDKCFYSTSKLISVKTQIKSVESETLPYKTGEINAKGQFIERAGGPLKIKTFPDPNWRYRYVVSCDQSKGYEDGDYSDMSVFDRLERDYIAYWNSIIPENELAKEFVKMGYFWQNALLVPESNRMTVINMIKPDGHERYMGEIYYDKNSLKTTSARQEPKWGYHTIGPTRKYLIDVHRSFMEGEDNYTVASKLGNYECLFTEEQVNEYLNFIRTVTGNKTKYQAASGHKDDIVIGDALCIIGDEWWDRTPTKILPSGRSPSKRVKDLSTSLRPRSGFRTDLRQSQLGKKSPGKSFVMQVGNRRQSQLGK
jgi:hypothetical protein